MDKIFVTGNQRLIKIYSSVLALIGAIIITGHMYYFVAGEKMNDWYTSLFLGIMALASGLPLAMGWKKPVLPEIHLNSEKMEWKRNAWNSSFQWDKLDRVEFNDRKLKITYAMTGSSDSLKIPYLTDVETIQSLKRSIRGACEHHNITFITDKQSVKERS